MKSRLAGVWRLPAVGFVVFVAMSWALLGVTCAGKTEKRFTMHDVARLRSVSTVEVSPDGEHMAYLLNVQRDPYADGDGKAWSELHVAGPKGRTRPFVTGEITVRRISWLPDGKAISFIAKRGEEKTDALYVIAIDGGEARRVLSHATDIQEYAWSPDAKRVAFLAKEALPDQRKTLTDKGFKARVFEEDWLAVRVWIATIDEDEDSAQPRMLLLDGSASEVHWSPAGGRLVVALAPTPLVDDRYMNRRLHVVDPDTGELMAQIDNPGKLRQVAISPDGRHVALISGEDRNDPRAGRLLVAQSTGGPLIDLLPGYEGHVRSIAWQDSERLVYVGHEGTFSRLGTVRADGQDRDTLMPVGGPLLETVSLSRDGVVAGFVASRPSHPPEVYVVPRLGNLERWTNSNPWLDRLRLAAQEVVTFKARDGLEIEGILMRPRDEIPNKRYPLILVVHGGPESHISAGWNTSYSRPGQFAAADGFAVFYPNYRGSTGRGVAFSKLGQSDYAGKEFDDLVDAVDHLVAIGLVDPGRVGITGGSYGGFASAWCATKLTEHFAASVMFVGISDQISKAGTTDIPHEMYSVHSRRWPWKNWDWFRERSPIYYVEQARTPLLIIHGEEDTRVHPSQSLELYRFMKLIGKNPVRLVLYPGEGHGNRKAAARLSYSMRLMRWMKHYLTGPGGDPPPVALAHDANFLAEAIK